MKLLPLALSTLALTGLISTSHAFEFSYNYAEAGYTYINDSEVDQGVSFAGSYDVMENINVVGTYFISTNANSDKADDVDVNDYTLGLGYHTGYNTSTDFLAEIGVFNTSADATVGNVKVNNDVSGHYLAGGVRHKLKDNVEVHARIDHRNSDHIADTTIVLGSRYYFKPNVSAGLEFNTGDDNGTESLTGSVRWNFK